MYVLNNYIIIINTTRLRLIGKITLDQWKYEKMIRYDMTCRINDFLTKYDSNICTLKQMHQFFDYLLNRLYQRSNIRSHESSLNYIHLPYPVLQHLPHEQVK